MAAPSFGLLFLLSMLTTGVSDLLDVVPTDAFWRAKNAAVTEQLIRAELAAPPAAGDISRLLDALADEQPAAREEAARQIRAMGPGVVPQLREAAKSGNPEVAARARQLVTAVTTGNKAGQVRKLMAIRAAGEGKMRPLLPRLAELARSDDPFVADYAAAAVAAIEGRPYARPHPKTGDDAWLLPAGTRAVLHLGSGGRSKSLTTADLTESLKMVGNAAGGPGGANAPQPEQQVQQMVEQVIAVAEKTGNVRIDGLTVGVSGDVGEKAGHVVLLVRGRFDARACADAVAAALPAGQGQRQAIAGVDAVRLKDEFVALFPSDTCVALVGGPREAAKPLDEVVAAIRTGNGPLRAAPEMVGLLGRVDTTLPVWGAVHVTENFRRAPLPLAQLDWVTLAGKPAGEGTAFRFEAKARNGPAAAEVVALVNGGVGQAKAALKQATAGGGGGVPPGMKKVVDVVARLMDSIKCDVDEADPTRATLTGQLDAPPTLLMAALFGVGVARAEPVPQPAPVPAPQP